MLPNNIFSTIVGMLTSSWNAVYGWFYSLLTATHARPYIIGTIMAMLIVRFTVYPFMKNRVIGGSDRARPQDDIMDAEYRRL